MTNDMLTQMLRLQDELQTKINGISPMHIDGEKAKVEYIRNMTLALLDEMHEALNETGWKPWASSNHINEEAFKNELVDAFHFFMNLMLVVDMTPSELYIRYRRKREKNIKRQDEGYDGLDKCPICKRAYDDEAVECYVTTEESSDDTPYYRCAATTSDMI